MVITATILLLECNAWEHNWTAVSLWFLGRSSLYRISIMGVLYCYYHLFSQNFTGQHDTTFLNGAPLSVTIFTRLPYWQIISSNSHCSMALAFSCWSAFVSIHNNRLHLLWTMYLQPFHRGVIWTISACNTWKIDSVWVTMGGISSAILCFIWHKWHML